MSTIEPATPALPWEGQSYSVKRFGISITNCDTEPVQTPGCVQGHGVLLALRPGDLTILQASENTAELLGHTPADLLDQPVRQVLGTKNADLLAAFLKRESVECNPLYVLTHPGNGDAAPLDVAVHTLDGVVLLEFEATARDHPQDPDYYGFIKHSVARLQGTLTLQELGDAATDELRMLTGLDRVMIHKFHDDGHGEIVAESRRADLPTWVGQHYPAQDIPEPAREVFRQIWIRPLREVGAPLAEMVPLAHPETGRPLSMTYCVLRGPSVMYSEYLQNMGVTACLTLAIRRGDKLWGLITCHHYAGPVNLHYGVRATCELLAQIVSLQHESAEQREHLAYQLHLENVHRQLVTEASRESGLLALVEATPSLLDGMDASGAALFHNECWRCVGLTPSETALDALGAWLKAHPDFKSPTHPIVATDSLMRDYPGGAALAEVASGLLAFALTRDCRSMVLWFRPEVIRSIEWRGDPHYEVKVLGIHGQRLTPRRSFDLFTESVRGCSAPWKSVEIDAALRFRMVVMELIVSRAEQLAELNADLARSNEELDAFAYVASHDLKEPLRGIYKYAHQLAEDAAMIAPENRHRLDGLMRLTSRMDSLLDSLLHFSRVGRIALQPEEIDLNEVLAEALEMVDARRREKIVEITIPRKLPMAHCDRVRMREVFVNLLSNAFKYNDRPLTVVEIGFVAPVDLGDREGWPATSSDQVIYYVKDNGIGIHARHMDQVFKMFKRLHGRDEFGGGTGAGLTIVKRLVERQGGIVWISSRPGLGSTFYFSLPSSVGY
ncbi:MAG: GAF domain-containing protein [Herminiimonas sp.]|nr:GAF domain-containing protein [Herminiimonas sp.]